MKFKLLATVLAINLVGCNSDSKNAAPIIFTSEVQVQFEQQLEFEITATDAENDSLTYKILEAPQSGLLTNIEQNRFVYKPADFATEPQQFSIEVSDGNNAVTKEIDITITDDRPFIVNAVTPQQNEQHIALNTSFELVFNSAFANEDIDKLNNVDDDGCNALIKLQNADNNCVDVNLSLGNNSKTLAIKPKEQLTPNAEFTLVLTDKLQNFAGTALSSSVEFDFRTAHQDLVISEVMLDPSEFKQRWLEIYNGTDKPVSLSQYSILSDAIDEFGYITPNHRFILPDVMLASGEHLIVQNDTFIYEWQTGFENGSGIVIIADNGKKMFWSNSGTIELTRNDQVIDAVYFGEVQGTNTNWQGASVNTTASSSFITRTKNSLDTNTADDWQLTQFPTAGQYNDVECQQDEDMDGIPDCSEQEGKTYAGLPLYEWGARAGQKDIFVEIDHMQSDDLGVIPQLEAVDKLVETFNNAGFKLHVDAGDLFDKDGEPSKYNLAGGSQVPFTKTIHFSTTPERASIFQYKHQYFEMSRRNIFHYMLFANSQRDDGLAGSSGYAEINGNDLLITLGGWGLSRDNESSANYLINIQASTMLHELGHNFGLYHGGFDSMNHKPNHLSVMNYMYQLQGLPTIGNEEGDRMLWRTHPFNDLCTSFDVVNGPEQDHRLFNINYSHGKSVVLDEAKLDESLGFGHTNSNAIDFNCSGKIDQETVELDYNQDGWIGDQYYDYDEWSGLNLRFNIDSYSASFSSSARQQELVEITPSKAFLQQIKQAKSN